MIQHFYAAISRASRSSRIRLTWVCAVAVIRAAIPAEAQGGYIYVANDGAGTVGLFTTEGVAVNPNLITGLVGVKGVTVADGFLYVSSYGPITGRIGKYTLMGEPINASLITGLTQPSNVAISGNDLFVINAGTNRVGKYTTSGATIDTAFITTTGGSTDAIAVSGSEVYVAIAGDYRIATYSASTGAVINNRLISSGVVQVNDLTISGSDLYVSVSSAVRKFSTSGTTVNSALVTGSQNYYGIGVLGSELYVSTFYPDSVIGKYTTSGLAISPLLIASGVDRPYDIEVVARIPEPSGLALFAAGAFAVFGVVLRRRCAYRIIFRLSLLLLYASAGLTAVDARAANTNWQRSPASPGDWLTPANWSNGVPTDDDQAAIANGGSATLSSSTAQAEYLGISFGSLVQSGGTMQIGLAGLSIDAPSGTTALYEISNGTLTVDRNFRLGYVQHGRMRQTGGTVTLGFSFIDIGHDEGSHGVYELAGGELIMRDGIRIGQNGLGELIQTGGTLTMPGNLSMGNGVGRYELHAGRLTTGGLWLGGDGQAEFLHTSGVHESTFVRIAGSGGARPGYPVTGMYTMRGDAQLNTNELNVGHFGAGTFVQESGSVQVSGALRMAVAASAPFHSRYELQGGSLQVASELIAENGPATFRQTGGTHTITGNLTVGQRVPNCSCTVNSAFELDGGELSVGGSTFVATSNGIGEFLQTGGVFTVERQLVVGQEGSPGKYTLQGGKLEVGTDLLLGRDGQNRAVLRLVGGLAEADVGGDLLMGQPIRLDRQSQIQAVIDDTGLTLLNIAGQANLLGTLHVEFAGGTIPTLGSEYVVLHADGGIVGGLELVGPELSRLQLSIEGQDVVLSVVPEPAGLALIGAGSLILLAMARRKWQHHKS